MIGTRFGHGAAGATAFSSVDPTASRMATVCADGAAFTTCRSRSHGCATRQDHRSASKRCRNQGVITAAIPDRRAVRTFGGTCGGGRISSPRNRPAFSTAGCQKSTRGLFRTNNRPLTTNLGLPLAGCRSKIAKKREKPEANRTAKEVSLVFKDMGSRNLSVSRSPLVAGCFATVCRTKRRTSVHDRHRTQEHEKTVHAGVIFASQAPGEAPPKDGKYQTSSFSRV